MNFRGSVARLLMLGVVWFAVVFTLHFAFMGTAIGDNWAKLIISSTVLVGAVIVSDVIMRGRSLNNSSEKTPVRRAQIEPETLRLRDMMALLDDDDLDDLRAEVREGVRDRIRRLSGSDVESFDDLLADASGKRKRGIR